MSRKLLLSSIAIAATATLLGAGAYAKFSDSEKTAITSITAGTLDLEVGFIGDNAEPAATPTYSVDNAKPGDVMPANFGHQGSGYQLHNAGSLPGALHVYLVKDFDNENTVVPPEAAFEGGAPMASGEIDNYLQVQVDGNAFGYGGVAWMGLADTPVDITSMIWDGPAITIPAGAYWPASPLHFGWAISMDATNVIMSDSLGFHLEFVLDQV